MNVTFNTVPDTRCYLGGAGTGKTTILINHVQELLAQGTDPADILVFCATPTAQDAFATQLSEAGADVRCTTARELGLEVLALPGAIAEFKREPRMVLPYEMDILMEDMKTSGERVKRLREMLKFFYKGWTQLDNEADDWFFIYEERSVDTLLHQCLKQSRFYIEPEICNCAIKWLRKDQQALKDFGRKHVVVDDFGLQNATSQMLASMLATESLWVAGDPYGHSPVFDSYPSLEGQELFTQQKGVRVIELTAGYRCAASINAAAGLLGDDVLAEAYSVVPADDDNGGFLVEVPCPSAGADLTTCAEQVAQLIEQGTKPGDIYVASPKSIWSKNLVNALADKGIKTSRMVNAKGLARDPREARFCQGARILTALALLANPEDDRAWRDWCALGEAVLNGSTFLRQRTFDPEINMPTHEFLRQLKDCPSDELLGDTPIYGIEKVRKAIAAARQLLKQADGLTGNSLLQQITYYVSNLDDDASTEKDLQIPGIIKALCGPVAEDDTAAEMLARAEYRITFPRWEDDGTQVRVGNYDQLNGLSPQVVVLPGFINGFIPNLKWFQDTEHAPAERDDMRKRDLRLLYSVVGKASQGIVATWFTETDLTSAGMLNLWVERIRLRNDKRVCLIAPSLYLKLIEG